MRTLIVLAGAVALSGCATATWSDDAVAQFVERAEMCAHWSGEEPYEAARRAEIEAALTEMRCSTLLRDGEALRLSRRERPEDLRRIDEALAGFE